jgi:RNA polymerase sigma factor (TIGR02999 family)
MSQRMSPVQESSGPGTQIASERLSRSMILAYGELRRLAQSYLSRERLDHTLQATALVHEAYLRLSRRDAPGWQSRRHFFNIAAQEMRRALIDHARRHNTARRGGDAERVTLREGSGVTSLGPDLDLVALDEALSTLATLDQRKAKVVELRFFAGMTIEETAELLNIAPVTVVREWRMAKAWIYREIRGGLSGNGGVDETDGLEPAG